MRFEEALKAMREGKEAKLGDYTHFIKGKAIWKHHVGGSFKLLWALYYDEIMSEDWEIVE